MTILALEFSSPQRSVALLRSDDSLASEVIEAGSGNNAPLMMIDAVLREAHLEREQIDCIVVGLGPGSYTGIRAAIALAQGWQLARGVKLIGIGSAECVLAQAQTEGFTGKVSVVIDAQRQEFYLTTHEFALGSRREIEPLQILTMADLRQREKNGDVLIGPEISRWFPAGKIAFPRAATLAKLAATRSDFIAGEKLEPIYLRETQFVKAPPPRIIL